MLFIHACPTRYSGQKPIHQRIHQVRSRSRGTAFQRAIASFITKATFVDRFDFYAVGDGSYQPEPGLNASLRKTATGYLLTTTTQRQLYFDTAGKLVEQRDALGHQQFYTYSGTQLTTVRDAITGRTLTLTYSGDRVSTITDHAQRTITFGYAGGDLAAVTDVRGKTTTYDYETNNGIHGITRVTPPGGSGGARLTQDYDPATGKLLWQQDASGLRTDFTTTAAPDGSQATQIIFSGAGTQDVLTHQYRPDGTIQYTTRNGVFESYTTFDRSLKPTNRIDGNGNQLRATYNGAGHPIQIQTTNVLRTGATPLNQTIHYDAANRPVELVAADGTMQNMAYTPRGALLSQQQVSATGAELTTTYAYSGGTHAGATGLLLPTRTTTPDGKQVALAYTDAARPWLVTQSVVEAGTLRAYTTTYQYDGLDRPEYVTEGAGTPEATTTRYIYNVDSSIAKLTQNFVAPGTYDPAFPDRNIHTRYEYDDEGRRIWTERHDNRFMGVTRYDDAGRILWVVDNPALPTGDNNPIRITSAMALPPAFDPRRPDSNISTFYGYDGLGRVTLITQTGILTGELDTSLATPFFTETTERVTRIEYDSQSRPVTRTLNYRPDINGGAPPAAGYADVNVQTYTYYDGAGNIVWQSDLGGRWTKTDYDNLGRPWRTIVNYENGNPTTINPANSAWASHTDTDIIHVTDYTANGRVARTIENYVDGVFDPTEPITDRITLPTYDAFGRTTSTTWNHAPGQNSADLNRTSATTFDPATGRVRASQDTLGQWSVPQYDDLGRVRETIQNCRDAQGNPAWTTCVTPADRTDRSISSSRTTLYDGRERVVETTRSDGMVTHTTYDALGRVLTTTLNYQPGVTESSTVNVATRMTYRDGIGRRVVTTDATGVTHQQGTDGVLRPISTIDHEGRQTWTWHDTTGMRWRRDPSGVLTVTRVDGLGRVVATVQNYRDGRVDGNDAADADVTTTTTYDRAGRMVATTGPDGRVTTYAYDQRDRLITLTENVETVATCPTTTTRTDCTIITRYRYDRVGNRVGMTDANGALRSWNYNAADERTDENIADRVYRNWGYDRAGRLKTEGPRVTGYSGSEDVWYAYDELGRQTLSRDPLTTGSSDTERVSPEIWTTYDHLGRRTSVREDVLLDPSVTATFTYDVLGRLRTSSDPNGTLTYSYDAAGRRTTLTSSSGYASRTVYDTAGRPATVYEGTGTAERPVATYAYSTTSGRLERVDRFDSTTTYTYDALGRMTRLRTTSGASVALDLTYHYNRAGERIRVDDSQRGTLTYSYDGLGRVTAETIAGVTTRWTYDRVGNRLTEAVGSAPPHTVRSYNGANQVVGWTYDVAGNLVAEGSRTDPNVNRYTYDIYNRLQKVDTPTTDRAYRYLDTMLLAEAGSIGGTADTTYVQDWGSGLSRIIQQTSNGTTSGFIYGPAGDRLLTTSSTAGDTYDLTDALGTVRATRSIAGSSLNDSAFTAWGTPTGTTTPAPFGFTGELQNTDTGLVYLRARWYNPATGTFLGRDPFDGRMTQSASLHLYQYGWNAPTMHTDPSGRDPWFVDPNDTAAKECYYRNDGRSISPELATYCQRLQESYNWRMGVRPGPVEPINWAQVGCILGGFAPYIGEGIDLYESGGGKECGTGEPLSRTERWISGGCLIIPGISAKFGRTIYKGGRGIYRWFRRPAKVVSGVNRALTEGGLSQQLQDAITMALKEEPEKTYFAVRSRPPGVDIADELGIPSKPAGVKDVVEKGPYGTRKGVDTNDPLNPDPQWFVSDLDAAWLITDGEMRTDFNELTGLGDRINIQYGKDVIMHGDHMTGLLHKVPGVSPDYLLDIVYIFDSSGVVDFGPMYDMFQKYAYIK